MQAVAEKWVYFLLRRRRQVLAVVLVLSALAAWGVVEIPFHTSRKALLPQNAEVTRRLDRFLEKFGADADLIVVLEDSERRLLEDFADRLSERLRALPEVREATEKVDVNFFLRHAYLLVPLARLRQFEAVMNRLIGTPPPQALTGWAEGIRWLEEWLQHPPPLSGVNVDLKTAEGALRMIQFFLEEWLRWLDAPQTPRQIDWQRMVADYGEGARLAAGRGYFGSRDGQLLFVFVRPRQTSSEFSAVAPFVEGVRREAGRLQAEFAAAGRRAPHFALTGLPAVTYEEFSALRRDIVLVLSTAAVFILLLVPAFLRSLRWAAVVFLPMGLGVLWNSGLTLLTVGHLTMITSAFTAVLFGLGVDYGIFLSSRIQEERAAGAPLEEAIARGLGKSFRAVLTAGMATVFIFASLTTVSFTGFATMGLVAASGVGMVLLATWLVQPLCIYWLPPSLASGRPTSGGGGGGLNIPRPLGVSMLIVALVAAAGGIAVGLRIPFDYDVLELMPRDSEAAAYQRRMVAESDYQAEVIIFTAAGLEQARQIAEQAAKLDTLAQVQTITDLFPADAEARATQAQRIGRLIRESVYLQQIRALGDFRLEPDDMGRLDSSMEKTADLVEQAEEMAFSQGQRRMVSHLEKILDQIGAVRERLEKDPHMAERRTEAFAQTLWRAALRAFDSIAGWVEARALTPADLPPSLRDRFFAPDGTVAIYAFPAESVYVPENLQRLLEQAYGISAEVTGFPTTHQEFSHLAVESFRQGTILAGIICLVWIYLSLRSLAAFLIAVLPLLLGGGWMLGMLFMLGIKFSYANIIALPLVMGLAVDYGVWYAHRWREQGLNGAWPAAWLAGKAIFLAATTTLAGLGAMILASYRGVATMGMTITLGLAGCLLTALFISPALADILRRPKRR